MLDKGHLVRIGPDEVVMDDLKMMRRMNAAHSHHPSSTLYEVTSLDHGRNHVISEGDEVRRGELRKQMNGGLHPSISAGHKLMPVSEVPEER